MADPAGPSGTRSLVRRLWQSHLSNRRWLFDAAVLSSVAAVTGAWSMWGPRAGWSALAICTLLTGGSLTWAIREHQSARWWVIGGSSVVTVVALLVGVTAA